MGNVTHFDRPTKEGVHNMEKALVQERAERIEDLRRMLPAPDVKPTPAVVAGVKACHADASDTERNLGSKK